MRTLRTADLLYRSRRTLSDERGLAMIMVVGTASVLAIIVAVIAVQSIVNLRQAGNERLFERALHVADAGVDHTLFKLRQARQQKLPDYTTGETIPAGGFASVAAERQWVEDTADAAHGSDPARFVETPEGEWFAIRPSNAAVIYSIGYAPSYELARKVRYIRAEYDFAPFTPDTAILTGGDLQLNGNPTVDGVSGNVHANGDVDVLGGTTTVGGYVSASGTLTGSPNVGDPDNTGSDRPELEVPEIEPRQNYRMSQYDLCPDGTVRTGPSYTAGPEAVPAATGAPCQGTILAPAGDEYRGWDYQGADASQGAQWRYGSNIPYDGVYYIYQGSARVTGSPGTGAAPWRVTIFAESEGLAGPEPHCPHTAGDIQVTGSPAMRFHDSAESLGFIAGRDLELGGNPVSGFNYIGVHAAHEQFWLHGTTESEGAVIANDHCNTPGSPIDAPSVVSGNPHITFNGVSVPVGANIRTTLWLEI